MAGTGAGAGADLILTGQVVLAFEEHGVETAPAIAIGDGRVIAAGKEDELREALPQARLIEAGDRAVVPGLHDFHLHLVGMARARGVADLTEARTMEEILARLAGARDRTAPGEWLRGDGWWNETLSPDELPRLERFVAGHPTLLKSHDRHSAWASAEALVRARIGADAPDPPGGRIERGPGGEPNGLLRERAADLVSDLAARLAGAPLAAALRETVADLAALGVTAATDAGDPTLANGVGRFAQLGDSFSTLSDAWPALAGSLRLTVNLPVDGLEAAGALGLRYGTRVADGDPLVRVGWAKLYADGALGSRTAALFEPYRCADPAEGGETSRGLLRITSDKLDERLSLGAQLGIPLAVHAIGDRTAATVLDALGRAAGSPAAAPHRLEHLQLMRPADRRRLAELNATASLQPVHLTSDRDVAERCWGDRLADAYAWRSLAAAGARMAFGSDAPIETPNPWLGVHAAVHRAHPGEEGPAWGRDEHVSADAALRAYTIGPALGAGRTDLGHLRPGARADLAVLNVDLATLRAADDRLASIRSVLTFVDGREVHA